MAAFVPNVTAIVVADESAAHLPDCLTALKGEGIRAIVVDDASVDVSAEIARLFGSEVLRNPRKEGFGRSANRGVARADSEFVLIVSPDIIVEAGTLAALTRAARRYPDAAIFAPRVSEPGGVVAAPPHSPFAPYLAGQAASPAVPEGDVCVPFVPKACFMIRQALFEQVGGFDQEIVVGHEDHDLCRRLTGARLALVLTPAARARRLASVRQEDGPASRRLGWHEAWSQAYVSRKYGLPSPVLPLLASSAMSVVAALVTLRLSDVQRHRGRVEGAFAWFRGETALAKEMLPREPGR